MPVIFGNACFFKTEKDMYSPKLEKLIDFCQFTYEDAIFGIKQDSYIFLQQK